MSVACSMASFGYFVQGRHGATCQRPMAPVPLVTIASFVGGGLASGTRSWMRAAGHDACACTSMAPVSPDNNHQDMGRSRGGLTSKIHAMVDTNGLPVRLALTPGEAHDNQLCSVLLRLASADDVTRGSWIRRGLDQGACPSARSMG